MSIPYITTEQVFAYMNKLEPTKATGLDGLGPSFLKSSAAVIEPSNAILINKSIDTGIFPSQRKQAKVFPILKGAIRLIHVTIDLS